MSGLKIEANNLVVFLRPPGCPFAEHMVKEIIDCLIGSDVTVFCLVTGVRL